MRGRERGGGGTLDLRLVFIWVWKTNHQTTPFCHSPTGETNAQSALKMLEFSIGPTGDISSDKTLLAWKPTYYFPQSEYLVRAGWLRDGSG